MMTPKFIQIVAAGRRDAVCVHGLTAEGDVYSWQSVYDDSQNPQWNKTHGEWRKLENPT